MTEIKHKIWAFSLVAIVFIFGAVVIFASSHPFTLRFELDDNALEAIKVTQDMQKRQYNQTNCHSEGQYNQCIEHLTIQTDNLDNSRQMEKECMDDMFTCRDMLKECKESQ